MRFLDHDDEDDPLLSVVNLIDLFLVVIGILLIVIAEPSTRSAKTRSWSSRIRAKRTCAC